MSMHKCRDESCDREFLTQDLAHEHAEAVHTFGDIREAVSEKIRETYGRRGQYDVEPKVPAIWTWVRDIADDWVVFEVETSGSERLYKAAYTMTDSVVTLGTPVHVHVRTVYEPVKD